jgi:hypothetical protein
MFMSTLRSILFWCYPQDNSSKSPKTILLTRNDEIVDDYQTVLELYEKDYILILLDNDPQYLPLRFYKEKDKKKCQIHGQLGSHRFAETLSIQPIYQCVTSFLVLDQRIDASFSQVNKLLAHTSKSYLKIRKPSLKIFTNNFQYCQPYLEKGIPEYNFSVNYVRRTCLMKAQYWLSKCLVEKGAFKNTMLLTHKNVNILAVEPQDITNDPVTESESDPSSDMDEHVSFFVARVSPTWPSIIHSICSRGDLLEDVMQKPTTWTSWVEMEERDFYILLSTWLRESENGITVVAGEMEEDPSFKKKSVKSDWLWKLTCFKKRHWKKKEYIYAADLFAPEKKRKKDIQNN